MQTLIIINNYFIDNYDSLHNKSVRDYLSSQVHDIAIVKGIVQSVLFANLIHCRSCKAIVFKQKERKL